VDQFSGSRPEAIEKGEAETRREIAHLKAEDDRLLVLERGKAGELALRRRDFEILQAHRS
jgi:hypothetical protein